jgi:hypothetical protein
LYYNVGDDNKKNRSGEQDKISTFTRFSSANKGEEKLLVKDQLSVAVALNPPAVIKAEVF